MKLSNENNSERWLDVGKIVGMQGLNGDIRINPLSEFPQRFTQPGERWIQEGQEIPKAVELIHGRQLPGKNLFVARFKGIANRSQAEELVGKKLLVRASDRPQLAKNEFHLLDLVNLEARLDPKGAPIGHVKNLQKAGNDLLEIKLINGKKVLIPFVSEIVPEVKLEEGWLLLTPPPGLLEL